MTRRPAYRFENDKHWAAALSAKPGNTRLLDRSDGQKVRKLPKDTKALAIADGEIWFIDDKGYLAVDDTCGPKVPVSKEMYLVVGPERVWVLTEDALIQFDRRTLQLLARLPGAGVTAIAPDAQDGLWRLQGKHAVHIDAAGRPVPGGTVDLGEPAEDLASADATVIALTHGGRGLRQVGGDQPWQLRFDDVLRDQPEGWRRFTGEKLGCGDRRPSRCGDSSVRFALVQGKWTRTERNVSREASGGVIVAPDGSIVTCFEWNEGGVPSLVALDRADLLALFEDINPKTTDAELCRFAGAAADGDIRLTRGLTTETLHGNWLSAEVEARLPEGATLTIRWASLEDQSLIATIEAIKTKTALTAAQRIAEIGRLLEWKDVTYRGLPLSEAAVIKGEPTPLESFSVSLHKATPGSTLYIMLRLDAQGTATAAGIATLSVTHDTEGLMAHLPAIYRGTGDPDGALRRVVGVLEATTQGIDERIADLARRLDPERADDRQLPALAAMLGLPFDAALSPGIQRAVVKAAPQILEHRGTREGLGVLLEALFPGRPGRIVDRATSLLPTTLGGSSLPSLLMGPTQRVPRLNARLVLGKTSLCAVDPCDDGLIAPTAEVIVTIPATYSERRRFGDALRQMLEAMLPAGLRLKLRWSAWRAGMAATKDVLCVVDSPLDLRIGNGQPLGSARIGGRRDHRIAPDGVVPVGHRLL